MEQAVVGLFSIAVTAHPLVTLLCLSSRNVFITEHHIKPNRLGRESPKVDTVNLPSTLDTNLQLGKVPLSSPAVRRCVPTAEKHM